MAALGRGELGCGDLEMRIDRDGQWYYRGSRIDRLPLVRLFASVLHRAENGDHWLITPVERGRIEVEDVPFTIVGAEAMGEGRARSVRLHSNLGELTTLDRDHPLTLRRQPGGLVPYLRVRGRLEARVVSRVYYELVELGQPAESDPDLFGLWSEGQFFPLGRLDEDASA